MYREFSVRLEFTSPCLGNDRHTDPGSSWPVFRMSRTTAQGSICFEPMWWRSGLLFAANLTGFPRRLMDGVVFDPIVDGQVNDQLFKRLLNDNKKYARHEAFLSGDRVNVNCIVPLAVSANDLGVLLTKFGSYRGISPFRGDNYGRFKVLTIEPLRQELLGADEVHLVDGDQTEESTHLPGRKRDSGGAAIETIVAPADGYVDVREERNHVREGQLSHEAEV